MTDKRINKLREHYDTTDASADLDQAILDDTVQDDPMIGITVRLPRAVLNQVRDLAASKDMKVTALIRDLVEQHVADASRPDLVIPVAALQRIIAEQAKPPAA